MNPRLYTDLAWLWPMWGDPETEYRDYCSFIVPLITQDAKRDVRTLLNVGCGGGKNVFNLKRRFDVTGLDRSPEMLALARALNPECAWVEADIRDYTLDRRFDAILIDDAISYMHREEDLAAVFSTAHRHLADGGIMVVTPDDTPETFVQNQTTVYASVPKYAPPGVEVTYVVNQYDPDPNDTTLESAMVFLVREHGALQIEHDLHVLGLFPMATWRRVLAETGFTLREAVYAEPVEGAKRYTSFVCLKTGRSPA